MRKCKGTKRLKRAGSFVELALLFFYRNRYEEAMPEKELLEQFNVSLCEFDSSQWSRDGFLDPVNRVVYINRDLPAERRLKVLLHELGHLEHNPKHYERLREKYEAQANRNMIHELLKNENLDDFNYIHFMEKYNLTTICDETFVKNEYLKLKEIEKC
nr:MAG: IrrE N-terminal-like domain [Bacteriophage sp.]